MSGNIAHTAVHVQNRAGKRPGHHCAAAVAVSAWLKIVGTAGRVRGVQWVQWVQWVRGVRKVQAVRRVRALKKFRSP